LKGGGECQNPILKTGRGISQKINFWTVAGAGQKFIFINRNKKAENDKVYFFPCGGGRPKNIF